jgi:hypothetical protein
VSDYDFIFIVLGYVQDLETWKYEVNIIYNVLETLFYLCSWLPKKNYQFLNLNIFHGDIP